MPAQESAPKITPLPAPEEFRCVLHVSDRETYCEEMLCWLLGWVQTLVFVGFLAAVIPAALQDGTRGVALLLIKMLRCLPGVNTIILRFVKGEVGSFVKQVKKTPGSGKQPRVLLPKQGIPQRELLEEMRTIQQGDVKPEDGKLFAYVYTADGDFFDTQMKAYDMFCESTGTTPEHETVVRQFHHAFMHENALNPMVFPSLRRFENEIVSMTAGMLNGDSNTSGSLTSGGTESLLMAMKTYVTRAKKLFPHITKPEMVAPITIHPAHEKAAEYFSFTIRHVPVGADFRPDLRAYERAITPSTIALLCSAPQYCHGVVDPVPDIGRIAERYNLPLHVDACFGGFALPWVEKLGHPVPTFDFRVPAVTSMSADIHKYGFGAKGASVVLYRSVELRKFQLFVYSQWPGGLFGSPSMAGTRPGGNIAAAWAALRAMGEDGYMKMAESLMKTTKKLIDGINNIPGLCVLGNPHMCAFSISSNDPEVDILAVADIMEKKGWKPERQQFPSSLHVSVMPHHWKISDDLLNTLAEAAKEAKANKALAQKGTAAMYGMVGKIPDKTIIDDFITEFFSEVYSL